MFGWGYSASAEGCVHCSDLGVSAKDEVSLQNVGVCADDRVSLSDIFHFGVHFGVLWRFSETWVLNSHTGEILTQKCWSVTQRSLTSPVDHPGSNWTCCLGHFVKISAFFVFSDFNILLLLIFFKNYNLIMFSPPLPATTHFPTHPMPCVLSATLISSLSAVDQVSDCSQGYFIAQTKLNNSNKRACLI